MENPTWKCGTFSKVENFAFSMAWNFRKSRLKKAKIQKVMAEMWKRDLKQGFCFCEQSLASLGSMAPGQSLVIVRTDTWLILDHSHSSAGHYLKLWHKYPMCFTVRTHCDWPRPLRRDASSDGNLQLDCSHYSLISRLAIHQNQGDNSKPP